MNDSESLSKKRKITEKKKSLLKVASVFSSIYSARCMIYEGQRSHAPVSNTLKIKYLLKL